VFADGDLTDDAFLGGRVQLWQPIKGYRAGTDPVLLAAACPATPEQSVLDLGCGVGAAVLCLALRVPGLLLSGLEVQPPYADLARRNAARNGVTLDVTTGNLIQMPPALLRSFDHVIANPPYYPRGSTPSPVAARDVALRATVPLGAWVEAASRRLHPGGMLTLICGTDALPEVLAALGHRMGSVAVLPLTPRIGRPALRIILRARKGGRGALRLLAPFVLHEGSAHDGDRNTYCARANAVLRDGHALTAAFG